jgi:hypothetical protein
MTPVRRFELSETMMPADGMLAVAKKGTSARPPGSSRMKLHQLPVHLEGGKARRGHVPGIVGCPDLDVALPVRPTHGRARL